jgi:hypothetical protein
MLRMERDTMWCASGLCIGPHAFLLYINDLPKTVCDLPKPILFADDTLCQKNNGFVKVKQRPVKMGGRTTYRTLSPNGAPFQIRVEDPICERCLEDDESATYILCDCKAVAHIRFVTWVSFLWHQVTTMMPP